MKIIFLDIDGPMIPTSLYLVNPRCSRYRIVSNTAIACLNEICRVTKAKIVLNTTHNKPFKDIKDIEVRLVEQGLREEYFYYTDLKTLYPNIPRDIAIKEYLSRHSEVKQWIALDDCKFTDEDNLILIDADDGLNLRHVNQALIFFGYPPLIVML